MRTSGVRTLAVAALTLAALCSCGAPDRSPTVSNKALLHGAVGFGESRDTEAGSHKVHEIVDPISADEAAAAGEQTPEDGRTVAAIISECTGPDRGTTLTSVGWTALLSNGQRTRSDVDPAPASEGSPTIDTTRHVPEAECVFARVLFDVPEGVTVKGVHYESGGAQTATWRESVS